MATTRRWTLLAACVSVSLLLLACDDNGQVATDSTVGPDGPAADLGDAGPADTGADLADDGPLQPDGPKLPAEWKTVQDPAPQVQDHTVTLLQSGEVLIAGGNAYDGNDDLFQDKTYRYDPVQNRFVDAGNLATARAEHVAALLNDGRVLVTGGTGTTAYLKSSELYDPTKPAASAWSAGPDMPQTRWAHSATLLNNGEVLIAGGFVSSDSTSTLLLFDPTNDSWKVPGATMTEGRKNHTATLLQNGKVLLAGGTQGASSSAWQTTYLDSLEIFDPGAGTVTLSKVKMSKKRSGHTAALLPSGKVLIVGGFCGNDCAGGQEKDDLYDPTSDTLVGIAHIGSLPSSHVSELLNDGRVLVAGGDSSELTKVVAFSPSGGGMWATLPSMDIGRWSAESTLLTDGTVLVVGGVTSSSPYTYADKAERFYP
jgi:hypothetical protein